MTGCVRNFDDSTTMSFKISNKQLLKKYNQIWKNAKSLLNIKFDIEPVYDDNDKYIKKYIYIYIYMVVVLLQIFKTKKCQNKKHPASNSARFCLQSKEKILFLKIFGRMQI